MREIKFRAWDKFTKKMWQWEECNAFTTEPGSIKQWFTDNDLEIMQYTGLKDKNGKEIYEGDIVEAKLYKSTKVFAVEWHSINEHSTFSAGTHNLTVIGNIYENLELVK